MKYSNSIIFSDLKRYILSLIGCLFFLNSIYSQTCRFKSDEHDTTGFLFTKHHINNLIGLCADEQWSSIPFTPMANFHIAKTTSSITDTALFMARLYDGYRDPTCFKTIFSDSVASYGIYQSSPANLLNYLQNRLAIGDLGPSFKYYFKNYNDKLMVNGDIGCAGIMKFLGDSTGVKIFGSGPDGFAFSLAASLESQESTELTIFPSKVKVLDTLECNNFRMINNAGYGRIMVSNQNGCGRWAYPTELFNDWIVNDFKDMYSNPEYRNIGIATETPIGKFQINSGAEMVAIGSSKNRDLFNGSGYIGFNAARRIPEESQVPEWIFNPCEEGDNGGSVIWGGLDGSLYFANITSNQAFGENQVRTDGDIAENVKMTITNDGDVGIGVRNLDGYKLAVAGKIMCTALKVKETANWPDYVFTKSYALPTLYEVEEHVNKNKRLPGIPGAEEIKKNGVDLGEMNAKLLEKVEELTLYLIDLQKQIDQLKSK